MFVNLINALVYYSRLHNPSLEEVKTLDFLKWKRYQKAFSEKKRNVRLVGNVIARHCARWLVSSSGCGEPGIAYKDLTISYTSNDHGATHMSSAQSVSLMV